MPECRSEGHSGILIRRSWLNRPKLVCSCNPLEFSAKRCIEIGNYSRVVVGDGVHLIQTGVGGIVDVSLRFGAREEAPAAVFTVVGNLAVHKPNGLSVYRDAVGAEARIQVVYKGFYLLVGDAQVFDHGPKIRWPWLCLHNIE